MKYAVGGQLGIIINKVNNQDLSFINQQLSDSDLDILGTVPYDNNLITGNLDRKSLIVEDAVRQFYYRLNLPQENK